jgi:hypothetical protein
MNTIAGINNFVFKTLSKTEKTDVIINTLASFGGYVESIPDQEFQKVGISPKLVKEKLLKIVKVIQSSEISFNRGLIENAYSSIYKLLFENNNNKILLEHSIPANNFFFRLRESKSDYLFTKEEMFHIPFELKHKIGNQRYSISGYPCLYLGSSIYGSWEELHRPAIGTTTIVGIKNTKALRLLDFRIPLKIKTEDDILRTAFAIACSIKVQNPNDPFKPEYIISQSVLHGLVKYNQDEMKIGNRGIHGIIYRSTHINSESTIYKDCELFDSLVIPVVNIEGIKNVGYCETLCDEFLISNPTSTNSYSLVRDLNASYIGASSPTSSLTIYKNSMYGILETKLKNEFEETDSDEMMFVKTKYSKINKDSIPERFRTRLI